MASYPLIRFFDFTSGAIRSVANYGYGIYEIKCRFPQNCKPAIWLYGQCGEEIDILELGDVDIPDENDSYTPNDCSCNHSKHLASVHKNDPCNGDNQAEGRKFTNYDYSDGNFHVFSLVWTYDAIVWYADGLPIRRCNRNASNFSGNKCINNTLLYPENGMNIRVTLSDTKLYPFADYLSPNGNNFCVTPNCRPQMLPYPNISVEMEIDYVRYWDINVGDCDDSSLLLIGNSINSGDTYENLWRGGSIDAINVTIKADANAKWYSNNLIEIYNNFETEDGAYFNAEILPCVMDGNDVEIYERINTSPTPYVIKNTISPDLKLYPNPSTGIFTLQKPTDAKATVVVYDVLGNQCLSLNINEGEGIKQIDLTNFPKGIYHLQLTEGDKMYSQKIVLQ